jgi:hypothetical protein
MDMAGPVWLLAARFVEQLLDHPAQQEKANCAGTRKASQFSSISILP